ncbi:MAG: hypothetical protein A2945_02180 [Candidatus Liptonbacteria bacterium RIFCSPLOWO2_01_FULL_52_25]|uniref:Uncharacterized protein n=1 Tax=Candidatus Liptonbacteria bacterium RIFCSPLOWO2_01_FULL_52_25 TaxID=1798650 RepID=A0A1G2CEZ4_9BACT|nr:MAG: hypothetical protein A2945_02180 [Candidatus Liptonbacteria bacterium RIFCSPLOWO2_01_FULL_52_25]
MVDVKKFITGFLILATLTSSLAFLFSNYAPTVALTESEASPGLVFHDPPPLPDNVFVEPVPNIAPHVAGATSENSNLIPAAPTSNVTESLARNVLQAIIETNPQGPYDANGEMNITPPDVQMLLANVPNDPAVKKLKVPDWETEVKALPLVALENPTDNDVDHYNTALRGIFDAYFVQSDIVNFTGQSGTDFDRLSGNLASALTAMQGTPVPAQFTAFHRSGMRVLFYMRNALELARGAEADPMQAALVFSVQERAYNRMVSDWSNEYLKVKIFGLISKNEPPSGFLATLHALLGVKTAYAQYPTWDFPSSATFFKDIADDIKEFIQSTLMMFLKQRVVGRILNDTVSWVQGNGTPLFITNWKGFLKDIADQATGVAIGAILPQACQSFRPLLQIALEGPAWYGEGYFPSCSLDRVLGNVGGFYNDFTAGGFLAYNTSLVGDNNLFAAVLDGRFLVAQEAERAAETAESEAIANEAFKPETECPTGSEEGGGGQCINPDGSVAGDAETLTPGSAVKDQVQNAFRGPGEAVTNSNVTWASLFQGFVTNVVNSLVRRGISNLRGATGF